MKKLIFAFPGDANSSRDCKGMTLRDYFAGQAISSIPLRSWDHLDGDDMDRIRAWAKCAYLVADAMLEEGE